MPAMISLFCHVATQLTVMRTTMIANNQKRFPFTASGRLQALNSMSFDFNLFNALIEIENSFVSRMNCKINRADSAL